MISSISSLNETDDTETQSSLPTKNFNKSDIVASILDPVRMDSLKARDKPLITYDDESFLLIFWMRGRNFQMIALPLFFLLAWDIGLVFLMDYFPQFPRFFLDENNLWASGEGEGVNGGDEWNNIGLGLKDLITPLLTPVSFLLVFRLGRAGMRFWDARAAMGKLIGVCRSFASTAVVHIDYIASQNKLHDKKQENTQTDRSEKPVKEDEDDNIEEKLLYDLARWTCTFPITVKNFLRPDTKKRIFYKYYSQRRLEIGSLLTDDEANDLLQCYEKDGDKAYATIKVLNHMRKIAHEISLASIKNNNSLLKNDMIGASVYRQLNEQIDTLTGSWGAMERVKSTPLPFVYVVHLRTFLMLYLFLWHVIAIVDNRWKALGPLFAASWALLGIEAASVECERPFAWHSNHLPLGKMCVVISMSVAQSIGQFDVIS